VSARRKRPSRPPDGRTRERLLGAAREVLEQGGYAGASVVAIAARAGLSAGALYRHFPSKAALFVEVFRAAADGELAALHAAATRSESHAARLDAVVASYARRALRNRRLAWALVYEPVDPRVDAERLAYRRGYCRSMAALLRRGIAAGEFPEQNAELTAAALVGIIAETLVGPLSPLEGEAVSETELVAPLLRLCRRAVGAHDVPVHAVRAVRASPRRG
jgi:AcrR family transcriptional regulator